MEQPPVTFIASPDAFAESIEKLLTLKEGIPVAFDIEATDLDPFTGRIILMQVGTKDWVNVYDVRKLPEDKVVYLLDLLKVREVISHNAKFEWLYVYEKYGIELNRLYDTMLSEVLILAGVGRPFYSLNDLTEKYVTVTLDKDTRSVFTDYDLIITPEIVDYAANDVLYLPYIKEQQLEKLAEIKSLRVHDLEMRLLPVIAKMEHNGVLLNREEWTRLALAALDKAAELNEDIRDAIEDTVRSEIEKYAGDWEDARDMLKHFKVTLTKEKKKVKYSRDFLSTVTDVDGMVQVFNENFNSGSPIQMKRMFHLKGTPVSSTNSKVMKREFPKDPFVDLIVSYREWLKRGSSFGFNFFDFINPKTGRIHSQFNQLGTATGRFASEKVNLQNVLAESEYRNCFLASEGYEMLTADYSQIELVIAADMSGDPAMIEAFLAGESLHEQTAIEVLGADPADVIPDEHGNRKNNKIYTIAKSTNFAIIYGTSAKGLATNFGLPHKEGLKILAKHKETYPKLHAFVDVAKAYIVSRGYSITKFGRRRHFVVARRFDKYTIKDKFRIEREGFNHIIQGGSADMVKLAMVNISELNPFGNLLRAILTVHDEVVYEARKDIAEEAMAFIEKQMVLAGEAFVSKVPVKVGIKRGPYWEK
jgi:DNA polymerase-1